MRKYKVKFGYKGSEYELEIAAASDYEVKKLVEGQYPGCNSVTVTEVKR